MNRSVTFYRWREHRRPRHCQAASPGERRPAPIVRQQRGFLGYTHFLALGQKEDSHSGAAPPPSPSSARQKKRKTKHREIASRMARPTSSSPAQDQTPSWPPSPSSIAVASEAVSSRGALTSRARCGRCGELPSRCSCFSDPARRGQIMGAPLVTGVGGAHCNWSKNRPHVLLRVVDRGAAFLGVKPILPSFRPLLRAGQPVALPVSSYGLSLRPPTNLVVVVLGCWCNPSL